MLWRMVELSRSIKAGGQQKPHLAKTERRRQGAGRADAGEEHSRWGSSKGSEAGTCLNVKMVTVARVT